MTQQICSIMRKCGLRIGANVILVVVEEDVLNMLLERLFRTHRVGGRRHGNWPRLTVTRTDAFAVPPAPLAINS